MPIKVGNVVQIKSGTIARTNTTDTAIFTLPANAQIIGMRAHGANSDAGTSATLTFKSRPVDGSSAAASFGTINAKSTVTGAVQATLIGAAYNRQSTPVQITCAYSESGTASTVGGAWTVSVEYI